LASGSKLPLASGTEIDFQASMSAERIRASNQFRTAS
jgi:hypothetical protein